MTERIDCRKPEPQSAPHEYICANCGRPMRCTSRGKFVHRRGYRRIWADPRKDGAK